MIPPWAEREQMSGVQRAHESETDLFQLLREQGDWLKVENSSTLQPCPDVLDFLVRLHFVRVDVLRSNVAGRYLMYQYRLLSNPRTKLPLLFSLRSSKITGNSVCATEYVQIGPTSLLRMRNVPCNPAKAYMPSGCIPTHGRSFESIPSPFGPWLHT